ncbi:vacuolar ATPase assembly integral membrane protein vma21 [Sorochytrium milnesiophthora]
MPAAKTINVPSHVVAKLIFFMAALLFGPITSYFYVYNYIFPGNSTYGAVAAVIVANVVVAGYVVVAFWEANDSDDYAPGQAQETKKTQ